MKTILCWKYKLLKPFYKLYKIPICCVGCKYARNNKCIKYKIKFCPKCGSNLIGKINIKSARLPFWWYLGCARCHWCGKTKLFLFRAIKSWNKERR